jgi:hypothetical protein
MKFRIAAVCSIALVVALGLLGGAYWAARQVPEFYEEALKLEPEVQQAASDQLLENATALASNARRDGHWQAVFTEEQINGWLAVDLARNYPELLPTGVKDPRVMLRPDGATVACRYHDGALQTVLSLEVELYMNEPNVVSVRLHHAKAGAIPVPLVQILDGISKAATDANFLLRWLQTEGDPVAIVTFPKPRDEEDTVYQLETVEIREGAVYVAGRTTRGNSEGSPTWDPAFKPVALAPGVKENHQR